jgi:hypothetical protein
MTSRKGVDALDLVGKLLVDGSFRLGGGYIFFVAVMLTGVEV